ncbi:MAG: bacterioferritin [Mycobacterium sp.]|nr:bacterioferritin [Mycobacterium sp.]
MPFVSNYDASSDKISSITKGADLQQIHQRTRVYTDSVYFGGADLPQMAKHFCGQAGEERNHAMRFMQYLLNCDVDVDIPAVDAVRPENAGPENVVTIDGADPTDAAEPRRRGVRFAPETIVTPSRLPPWSHPKAVTTAQQKELPRGPEHDERSHRR